MQVFSKKLSYVFFGLASIFIAILLADSIFLGGNLSEATSCIEDARKMPSETARRLGAVATMEIGDREALRWMVTRRIYERLYVAKGESIARKARLVLWNFFGKMRFDDDSVTSLWISLALGKCRSSNRYSGPLVEKLWTENISNRQIAEIVIIVNSGGLFDFSDEVDDERIDRLLMKAGLSDN